MTKRLSPAQRSLLERAVKSRNPDGAPFIGYSGRLRAARILRDAGLVELIIPGGGRMPRILGTDKGRRALGEKEQSR